MSSRSWSRRQSLGLLAGGIALPGLLRARGAQAAGAGVVVVGGGFAGSAVAGAVKARAPEIEVVLLAPSSVFHTCPGSNAVIAGLAPLSSLALGFDDLRRRGVDVRLAGAEAVDPAARRVRLGDGTELAYDRLVLAPGVEFDWSGIEGLSAETVDRVPHAWTAGPQTALLRDQLRAMPEDGVFVLSAPRAPFRCPPAVGERLSLIAHTFLREKPRARIVALDARPHLSLSEQFHAAWDALYPGMIEYHGVADDGVVRAVDPGTLTVATDFAEYAADVVNVIPPQRAGAIARDAGLADATGWCPVEPASMRSTLAENVYVVGDAALAPPLPKAASAAVAAAHVCAANIVADLRDRPLAAPEIATACYALAGPDWGLAITGTLAVADGKLVPTGGGTRATPVDAGSEEHARLAARAAAWHRTITEEVWGKHGR